MSARMRRRTEQMLHLTVGPSKNPGVTTVGRINRQALEARQVSMVLPEDLRRRIDRMIDGGGQTAAYLALVLYAVDTLERDGLRLRMEVRR